MAEDKLSLKTKLFMANNSDTTSIVKYLKSNNIKLDYDEFTFQVESHPDYPSLLSFSDALNFFKIKNYALKIDGFNLEKIPKSFVALLRNSNSGKPRLSLVKNLKDKIVMDGKTTTLNELAKDWTGIILLTEEREELNIIEDKTKNRPSSMILLVISLILFVYTITMQSPPTFLYPFYFLVFLGLLTSVEIFKNVLGVKSPISEKFCGSNTNTDCFSIINSKKWSITDSIPLSDLVMVFFSGQIISLFLLNITNEENTFFFLHYYGLWLTIPISLVSIYFQWKIEKKWCPLCLTIILILYFELLLIQFYPLPKIYSIKGFILYIASNLFVISCWLYFKNLIVGYFDLNESKLKNLRFRKNYQLFKNQLRSEELLVNNDLNGAFIFGNPKSNVKIFMSTNPYCGYCKKAHEVIENILERYSSEIGIFMRFNFNLESETNKEKLYLHRSLAQHYLDQGCNGFLMALKSWFEEKDLNKWKQSFDLDIKMETVDDFLKAQYYWCENNKMYMTPTLAINGKKYPDIYSNEDLIFFLEDLIFENNNSKLF